MNIREIPPLELRLEDANKYGMVRVGKEVDGNQVYACHRGPNVDLYRLVFKKNGLPAKQMLVLFYTGRENQ